MLKRPRIFTPRYKLGILLCISLLLSQGLLAAPALRAVGAYSELGQAQFLVGVYTEDRYSSANELILSDQEKAMEVRIVDEKMFARRFRRLWQEGAAINASSDEFKAHSQSMVQFIEFVQLNMEKNDVFRIHRIPDKGVNVSVNRVLLGSIKDPSFFDLLLRVVVGPVPISNGLKKSITSPTKQAMLLSTQFRAIKPSAERRAMVQRKIDNLNSQKLALQKAELKTPKLDGAAPAPSDRASSNIEKLALATPQSGINVPEPSSAKAEKNTRPVIKAKNQSKKKNLSILDQIAADNKNKKPALPNATVDFAMLSDESEAINQASEVNELIASEQAANKARKLNAGDISGVLSSSERIAYLIARKGYFSAIVDKISKTVNKKKAGAQIAGNKGNTVIRVTINVLNDGEIKSLTVLNPSKDEKVNAAAKVAVYDATPLPKFPDNILDDALDMTIPVGIDDAYLLALDSAGRI